MDDDNDNDDEVKIGGPPGEVDRVVASVSGSPDVVPIDEDNNQVADDAANNNIEDKSPQTNC